MQIALTKSLATEMKLKPGSADVAIDPIFTWTATWAKVWDDSKTKEMLVLVNNATRFPVVIYPVKRKDLRRASKIIRAAIEHTLRSLYINPELIDDYFRLAGAGAAGSAGGADGIEFVKNSSTQTANWLGHIARTASYIVANRLNQMDITFDDTIGVPISYQFVNYAKDQADAFRPSDKMINSLAELTGKPIYKTRAFELLVTLDLDVYQASRRIIVPPTMEFSTLHRFLQDLFNWKSYHLYEFEFFDENPFEPFLRLVPFEEGLEYDEIAILMANHTLEEYLPQHKHLTYIYDMGDYWKHKIELVRTLENFDQQLPYLVDAEGQAPPEDVGGVGGFLEFREIMLDPDHPEHEDMKSWAEYWKPELSDRDKLPGPRRIWW